jgi:hypothetical protein
MKSFTTVQLHAMVQVINVIMVSKFNYQHLSLLDKYEHKFIWISRFKDHTIFGMLPLLVD